MKSRTFSVSDNFKIKTLEWVTRFQQYAFFNYTSCHIHYHQYTSFPSMVAAGSLNCIEANAGNAFNKLKEHITKKPSWLIGHLGYDLKNEIENLSSNNSNNLKFPDLSFFESEVILNFKENIVEISSVNPEEIFEEISNQPLKESVASNRKLDINQRVSKDDYISNVERIKEKIYQGDIYELNYCIEFFSEDADIDPISTFIQLSQNNPMPYSVLFRNNDQYIISASPERFLKKEGKKLISQPMKGTAPRSSDHNEDLLLKENLRTSEKERSENMMIVDLVRNDLSKSSVPGSVKVEELFGVYSLSNVHQMVSTVVSEIKPETHCIDAIRNAFPMGSMTGAPKIRAMELIEEFESTRRGIFSGALGYINPEGDFDFNVVIRSIIYNKKEKYLSFQAGSAITYDSDAEKEYQECLLKASAIKQLLES